MDLRPARTKMKLGGRFWQGKPVHPLLWALTAPCSLAYAGVLPIRAAWWRRMARGAPLATVSVGNLTVGGSGKTPFSLFLASRLQQSGCRVGIVSRGYGGKTCRGARLVSDGATVLMTPREAGDEPVMLARSFDGHVAVARRRLAAIKLLAQTTPVDTIVLDDAFQHIRLRRDVDLLLISRSEGFGNEWLLPSGPLREPWQAIRRADAIVLIGPPRAGGCPLNSRARALIASKPHWSVQLAPSSLVRWQNGGWNCIEPALEGRRVVLASGVANPGGFHAMIRQLGAEVVSAINYPDHHDYGRRDWENILAASRGADMLITTEKDLVKLERFSTGQPLYALRLAVTMEPADEFPMMAWLRRRLAAADWAKGRGVNRVWH